MNSQTKKVLSVLLIVSIVLSAVVGQNCLKTNAANILSKDIGNGWTLKYSVISSEVHISGHEYDEQVGDGNLVIPETIDGYPVEYIARDAFSGSEDIHTLTIPKTVRTVSTHSIFECPNLTKILVNPDNPYLLNDENGVLFSSNMAFLYAYPSGGTQTEYSIPDGVLYIDTNAFAGAKNLTKVYIPQNVQKIGIGSFIDCPNLSNVEIDSGVTSIGQGAFKNCKSLSKISLPDSISTLDAFAFENCTSLTSFKLPNAITEIQWDMFRGCIALKSIEMSDSITTIDAGAFRDCSSLTSINISKNLTSIGYDAFKNCTSLSSFEFNNKLTLIGREAFYCTGLTSVTIPDSVTSMGENTFFKCINLKNVSLSSGITVVPKYTFSGCIALTDVSLYKGTTEIGEYAFKDCDSLVSIELPSSLNTIDNGAFYSCDSLTSITLPDSVISVGNSAFSLCSVLQTAHFSNSIARFGSSVFPYGYNLLTVYYDGTMADWTKLKNNSAQYNYGLQNAKVVFLTEDETTHVSLQYEPGAFDTDVIINISPVSRTDASNIIVEYTTSNGAYWKKVVAYSVNFLDVNTNNPVQPKSGYEITITVPLPSEYKNASDKIAVLVTKDQKRYKGSDKTIENDCIVIKHQVT